MVLENTALVYSNFSKTNQFLNRSAVIPLCSNETKALDPIFHLTKLYSTELPLHYPAFSYIDNNVVKCITYTQFTTKLKALLDMVGYSPELYSGHSL